jgi:hypothetical protein
MRYLLVLLPLAAAACAGIYDNGYAYRDGPRYAARESAGPYNGGYSYGSGYYDTENCGTPNEPRACPPLPRRPLPYYPGDRD